MTFEPRAELLARVLAGRAAGRGAVERLSLDLLGPAGEHGVQPILWRAAEAGPDFAVELRAALEPIVRGAATREIFVRRELAEVTAALAAAGVPAMIVKGSALAYTAYPEPWLRPRTDTDILVRCGQASTAAEVLAARGYRRSDALSTGALVSHQFALERLDQHGVHHVLDIHWKIANPQVVADALLFDDLWQRREPAPALGPAGHVPCAVDSIVLACVHRLAHHQGHDRLIWLYDLKLLAASLEDDQWQELATRASSRRVAGLCLDGLRQTRARLDGRLPPGVEAALAAAAPGEPSQAYLAGAVRKRDVLVSDLTLLRSWRDRFHLLREHALPPAAFIRQRYGINSPWLLPVLYAHRLVTGAYRWVRT